MPMKPAAKKTRKSQKAKEHQPRPKRKLNYRQERFCELIAAGESGVEAWLKAGYKVSRDVARTNAAESLANPRISERVAELRKPQTSAARLTKEEKLRFLKELIETPVGEVTERSRLAQEVGFGKDGRKRIKMGDKLRALELHSRLVGDFEPENIVVEAGPLTLESIRQRALHVASALAR